MNAAQPLRMPPASDLGAAWIVILGGVSAALHVAKLPPALPVLQRELGLGLVQAGFLLSLVQLASMALGLLAGLLADGLGLRRVMIAGLTLLSAASLAAGFSHDVGTLLALRALEGIGFLLATVPAPSLVRRSVTPQRLTRMLGFWGAFMPFGTAAALLFGPLVLGVGGWPGWAWTAGVLSACMAALIALRVAPDPARPTAASPPGAWRRRLAATLGAAGPWLGALTFAVYSAQWLAVIGFLPSLYAQSGWSGAAGAVLTALVAAVNIVGNVAAASLLSQGVAPRRLLWIGFGAMALGGWLAFDAGTAGLPWLRYLGALMFSTFGGFIPGSLFGLAPRLAPDERTVATTIGWMMQWSALGQVSGPPLVAWVASRAGGWHLTWVVTLACCAAGAWLAQRLGRLLAPRAA